MKSLIGIAVFLLSVAALAGQKTTAAVLPLRNNGGLTEGEVNIITDRLDIELQRSGKFRLVNRREIDQILKEQGFQHSGACDDQTCAVEVGQILSVEQLATGSIGKMGSMYSVTLKIYDVQTGVIVRQAFRDLRTSKEKLLSRHIGDIVTDMVKDEGDKPVSSTKAAKPKLKGATVKPAYIAIPTGVVVGGGIIAAILLATRNAGDDETGLEQYSEITVAPPSRD